MRRKTTAERTCYRVRRDDGCYMATWWHADETGEEWTRDINGAFVTDRRSIADWAVNIGGGQVVAEPMADQPRP